VTYLENYRSDGRLRAAGTSLKELRAEGRERRRKIAPKDKAKPLLLAALAKRPQWSPREMKLAIAAAVERHHIRMGHLAAAVGLEESALSRALCLELDMLNIGYLAAASGYEAKGFWTTTFTLRPCEATP
jgi:hypothetical protein